MNIQIRNIVDKNNISKERVILKALANIDIGRFGIFRTGKNDRGITSKVYDTYWFPDKNIKAGDLVVLYTKSGISSETSNEDGSTYHFFYLGQTSAFWQDDVACVLISIPEWQVYGG